MPYDYQTVRVEQEGALLVATIDHPPINLLDHALYVDLLKLSKRLYEDPEPSVVVLKSAVPGFFIAHFDVAAILEFPAEGEAAYPETANPFHVLCERFATMDKVTIAQIEGRAGGGGSELASAFDMRFGVLGQTVVNQMEVPLGILPGGSGTQRLPRLLGRGRAMEVILGAGDLDAATAERRGYLNRAFPPGEIEPFVADLAHRIASFPKPGVRLAKAAIDASGRPLAEGLREEAYLFERLLRTEEAPRAMRRFLDLGGQTPEGERRVGALSAEMHAAGTGNISISPGAARGRSCHDTP